MNETGKFKIALLPCGATQWSEAIEPLLRIHAVQLDTFSTAEELLAVHPDAYPEIICICHQPGIHECLAAAEQLRSLFLFTPILLLAFENNTTLKAALAIGASAIVEPPFRTSALLAALNGCQRQVHALRGKTGSDDTEHRHTTLDENSTLQHTPESHSLSAQAIVVSEENNKNPYSSMKILVAEDLPSQQTIIQQQLELIGCQAVIVANGSAAVEAFECNSFDAILMDLNMPIMDGFKAARIIRQKELVSGGRIPMVALTSYSVKEILDTCLSIGMDGYLVKPVATKKLEATLLHLKKPEDASAQLAFLTTSLNGTPVLAVHAILAGMAYNFELYQEMIDIYLATYSGLGDELAEMLCEGNLQDMSSTARSLEAIVANIGGTRLGKVARLIQDMCQEGKIPLITLWMPVISAESAALKAALLDIDGDSLRLSAAEGRGNKI
jgi:CheY-like chemotaxis protein